MPNYTNNLKLIKPLENEFYDINQYNDNMDIIDGVVSNVNLLDNPFFTINQRGQTTYQQDTSSLKYCVDRWAMGGAINNFSVDVVSSGLVISKTDSSSKWALQHKVEKYQDFAGKTMTLSINIKSISGDAYFGWNGGGSIGTVSEKLVVGLNSLTFDVPEGITQFTVYLMIHDVATIEVISAKLEYGSVSTLANDSAPDYATELLKCRRYYYKSSSSTSTLYLLNSGEIRFVHDITPMRTTPSIDVSQLVLRVNGTNQSGWNITGVAYSVTFDVYCKKSSHGLNMNSIITLSGYVELSADL